MKKGWQCKTLGEVCVFDKSQGLHKKLPYVGLEHIESNTGQFVGTTDPLEVKSSTFRFTSEHLLYGRLRPYLNKVMLPNFTGHCSTEIFPIKQHPGLSRKFLQYWFLKDGTVEKINATSTGARMPRANMNAVLNFEFLLPPLPEQKRIVGILDKAFAAISTAKANAEKNLQNARELFESYLQGVFANPGDGWVEMRIADVCTLKSGTTVSAALEKTAGDLPYLKVADMTHAGNEVEIVSSSRFLNKADIGRNAVLPSGTTIFPKRGGAILTNKKRLTAVPICADLNIMGVIPGKSLLPKYLYFYFLNIDMRQIGSGSSIPQINNYDIEPLVISFPKSAGQQAEIVSKLDKLSTETQRLESIYQQKIADLDELKKSVLQKAFNGELAGACS